MSVFASISFPPRRLLRGLAAAAAIVVIGTSFAPSSGAWAEGPSDVSLVKEATVSQVTPGETFSYELTVECTAVDVGVGCTNAVLTDPVPASFTVEHVEVSDGLAAAEPAIVGNTVTVTFTEPLPEPAGGIGLSASATGVVTITVQARSDLPMTANGVPIVNTATLDASNAIAPATATAPVTPIIDETLTVTATKSFSPDSAVAVPGSALTTTLTGTNTSNSPVDTMVFTDPPTPTATGGPFDELALGSLGTVTLPTGADLAQVDTWTAASGWTAGVPAALPQLPAGIDPSNVLGVRVTFTSSTGTTIAPSSAATIELRLMQRDSTATLSADTTITNTVAVAATRGDGQATATATAQADYLIRTNQMTPAAGKSFDPNRIVAGGTTTLTLTATNDDTLPASSLRLTEPAPDAAPNVFPAGVTFTGFASGGDRLVWPAGASSALITWTYRDGTAETLSSTTPDTLPAANGDVARFTVDFSGDIAADAEGTLTATFSTDPDLAPTPLVWDNTVTVDVIGASGAIGTAQARDTVTIFDEHLTVSIGKEIYPRSIPATAGAPVTVLLPTVLAPFPDSTVDATSIVIDDPSTAPSDWWNSFDATAITQTAIPAGATLNISYWDGTGYLPLPGTTAIPGPQVFNQPIPAGLREHIQGLRFEFTSAGFAPGTRLQPNFGAALRSEHRDGTGPATVPGTIGNCAAASTDAPNVTAATGTVAAPCPTVELLPVTPGEGDLIDKTWLESVPGSGKTVTARSEATVPTRLNWSTGGYANLDTVTITDSADADTLPLADSVYNAFDLHRIEPITTATDPWIRFDQVLRVELFNGTSWSAASGDPCPGACDGTFPGLTLTAAEQATTVGVRLVFAESPTRANTIGTDPTAPPVGSGVARSTGKDRAITLAMVIRDLVRDPVANPDPVVGSRPYNASPAEPGFIVNTAHAAGRDADGIVIVTDTAADTLRIIDVPLNVHLTKTWTGGPLGLPPAGTPASAYPSGRVTLTAQNVTAASVDTLTITEPAPGSTSNPFDVFSLKTLRSISTPTGATASTVTLTYQDGTVSAPLSVSAATALSEASLTDVVAVHVQHTGRITAGATTTIVFDTRLRSTHRSTGTPVTVSESPIVNQAFAQVDDLGGTNANTPTTTASADIELAEASLTVTAGKTFSPPVQQEPARSPVTMTLTGQPDGTVRPTQMTLSDDTGTFWNAYNWTGLAAPIALTAPINRVTSEVCLGRTITDPALDCVASGGQWVSSGPLTQAQFNANPLPPAVNIADIQGVRFTFTRADGTLWENPSGPTQRVAVQVQRRLNLRTGGPVPSDLSTNTPAPGESAPGITSNTVTAAVIGAFSDSEDAPPLTASDTADATIRYQHSRNAVTVTKTPSGTFPPGKVFTYQLTVTNSGNTPVMNPVITDRLPTDAAGTQLIFDPAADPASSPFSYTLTGTAPTVPNGSPMPQDTAHVTAEVAATADRITFHFPAGSVLEVGQSYRVSMQLMFRPGLSANTPVTNSFGVTGDRPWDACTGTLDPATGECRARATVTLQLAAAIRGVKSVQAVDGLGVNRQPGTTSCTPTVDGFYRGGCVPVTKPGGSEIWRSTLTNTGTLPMTRMVAVDRLPAPGDTGVSTPLPRGSQWAALFEGTVELTAGPPGARMTTSVTTATTPCIANLNATGPGCPAGSWLEWTPDAPPVPAEQVTAIQTVFDFPTPLRPAGLVSVDITTRTPAVPPSLSTDPIAWNTVAVAGLAVDGARLEATPPTEGNKVGAALATGTLAVSKAVTGGAVEHAPEQFTATVTCTSAGTPLPPARINLRADGTPTLVPDLPWGATCTVTEDDFAQSSSSAGTAIITRDPAPMASITLTNRYDLASLVVGKQIDTDAYGLPGEPIDYGTFTITTRCTFRGVPVWADGHSAANPMTAVLPDQEHVRYTGLPARAECTITEPDTHGAASVTITTETSTDTTTVPGSAATVTLTADDADASTNTVTVTNQYASGSVAITKHLSGPGASLWGQGPFTVRAVCTLNSATGLQLVRDQNLTLRASTGMTSSIPRLPAGATCSITEPGAGMATGTTITPDTVTVPPSAAVPVDVTNDFQLGAVRVTKTITGAGATHYGAGPFEVRLTCTHGGLLANTLIDVPGGDTRTLTTANGFTAVFDDLPANASCTLTETASAGATRSIIEVIGTGPGTALEQTDTVQVTAGATRTFQVTNEFAVGAISVTKVLTGTDIPRDARYTVQLRCTAVINGVRTELTVPGGSTRTLSQGTTLHATYEDLLVGARCELTEPEPGTATGVTITPNEGDPDLGVTTVAEHQTRTMTVTNTFGAPPGATSSGQLAWTGTSAAFGGMLAALFSAAGVLILAARTRYRKRNEQ